MNLSLRNMKNRQWQKRKALEAAGYRFGDAADFLGMDDQELKLLDARMGAAAKDLEQSVHDWVFSTRRDPKPIPIPYWLESGQQRSPRMDFLLEGVRKP